MDTEDKKPNEPGTVTQLTHIDDQGQARMVDVGGKEATRREAIAEAIVTMSPETLRLVVEGQMKKGDVFGAARLAGIMAAKKTPELIPLCHPLPIDAVQVDFTVDEDTSSIVIKTTVGTTARTGVEMEAMVAAAVAALTVYDMCKAAEKGITITGDQADQKERREERSMAKVVAVNISTVKGVRKHTVPSCRLVIDHGIEGDAHAGNWHRQVSLLAQESIDKMQATTDGHPTETR